MAAKADEANSVSGRRAQRSGDREPEPGKVGPPAVKAAPPKPSAEDERAIDAARTRQRQRGARLQVDLKSNAKGGIEDLTSPHSDWQGWRTQLQDALGTSSGAFMAWELSRLIDATRLRDGHQTGEARLRRYAMNAWLEIMRRSAAKV